MNKLKKILSLILAGSLMMGLMLPAATADSTLFTDEMVQRSLLSVGNTQRMHKAIEKAKNGEDVTLVYLGGSITEGSAAQPQKTKCYAASNSGK